jgi:hypothetical protein
MSANSYVGAINKERVNEIASKALENQIHRAIDHLKSGQTGKYAEVIAILNSMIGEEDNA